MGKIITSFHPLNAQGAKLVFTSAGFDSNGIPHISKLEHYTINFADSERSQYTRIWKSSDYAEVRGLWHSNASRRLKEGELLNKANVVTGKWSRNCKTGDRENTIKPKAKI